MSTHTYGIYHTIFSPVDFIRFAKIYEVRLGFLCLLLFIHAGIKIIHVSIRGNRCFLFASGITVEQISKNSIVILLLKPPLLTADLSRCRSLTATSVVHDQTWNENCHILCSYLPMVCKNMCLSRKSAFRLVWFACASKIKLMLRLRVHFTNMGYSHNFIWMQLLIRAINLTVVRLNLSWRAWIFKTYPKSLQWINFNPISDN